MLSQETGSVDRDAVTLESVEPNIGEILINGRKVEQRDVDTVTRSLERATRLYYSWIECNVKWNQRCAGGSILRAWEGWQACQPVYHVAHLGGHFANYAFYPTDWYANDPESPDRFRAFSLSIEARGNGNIFNQIGARVRLENVGLTMVPASYNNYQRYSEGCNMPTHD